MNDVFQAVDIVAESRIKKYKYDQTIEARIVSAQNKDKGMYRVECSNGYGNFTAYSIGNQIYNLNDIVYVLIPLGDFSQTKYIISLKNYSQNRTTHLTLQNNFGKIFLGNSRERSILLPNDSELNCVMGEDNSYYYIDSNNNIVAETKDLPQLGPMIQFPEENPTYGNFTFYIGDQNTINFGVRTDGTVYGVRCYITGDIVFDNGKESLKAFANKIDKMYQDIQDIKNFIGMNNE